MILNQWPDFPQINQEHLSNAQLYANRYDMITGIGVPTQGKIAEIGVWRAHFSKILVPALQPRQFFAFDIFTGHLETEWNGTTGAELFAGLTHQQYYEREMAPFGDVVTVVAGPSAITLRNYLDHSFDLVYVDAAHDYESVKADTELAVDMVAPRGYLVFNDYVLLCPAHGTPYGVVPVVNELVVNQGWRVAGFALHHTMYCDIALRHAD